MCVPLSGVYWDYITISRTHQRNAVGRYRGEGFALTACFGYPTSVHILHKWHKTDITKRRLNGSAMSDWTAVGSCPPISSLKTADLSSTMKNERI